MMFRRNILIFHAGALGDFVLTWPLALALGRLFPQSRVMYVTHGQKGALAERVLRVESQDVERGWHLLFGDAEALPQEAKKLLAAAHSIYSFISTPGDPWTENVQRLSGGTEVVALHPTPPADFAAHVTQHLISQLQPRPAIYSAAQQLLHSITKQGIRAFTPAEGGILIHPGSGSPQKCWPVERFVELINRLKADGHSLRIILGEVEEERLDARQTSMLSAAAEIVRPATYVALAEQLAGASLVLANDSGPGHLSAMLGVPTLSLFGPTDPKVWRPIGPSVEVLRERALESLAVADVYNAIKRMLGRGRILPAPMDADND